MISKTWDKSQVGSFSNKDSSESDIIHPIIFRIIGNAKNKKIADYGCGEGELLHQLSEQGAKIFGYDISESMISEAKKRTRPNATLKKIQSGVIPLPNNSLDAVVSNLVLMMCDSEESIRKIHKEINRVLKPEGNWIYCITHPAFTDKTFTTYRNIFSENRYYLEPAQPYQFVLRKKDGTEITDEHFIDYHYPISTYLNLLPETGFKFRELVEVSIPGNKLPPYIIVNSTKAVIRSTL